MTWLDALGWAGSALLVYSLLQACGLVNDHLVGCPVRDEVEALRLAC